MNEPKIVVKINKKTGVMKSEAVGMVGTACESALNWVGKLGDGDKTNKPDYFQDNYVNNTISE